MHLLKRLAAAASAVLMAAVTAPCGSMPCSDRSGTLTAAAAPVEIPGIDVSKYQEEIDWNAVAESGVKFAILRCCKVIRAYNDWEFDSRFNENYEGAKAAGIAVGCYIFTDAATEREFSDDVAYMLGYLKDKSFEFPVFFDLESASRQEHLSPNVFMPALLSGLEQIEAAGHTAGVYSSNAFFNECIDRKQLQELGYPIWEAHYFNTVNGLASPSGYDLSDRATIWQYSGCGRAGGIRTTVDRNICYTYQFFNHMATISEQELPEGVLTEGDAFTVSGLVSSGLVLRSLTGTIVRITPGTGDEEAIQSVTVYPHAKDYRLAGFFTKKLDFATLTEGQYVLRISASDSAGMSFDVASSEFTVVKPGAFTSAPEEPAVTETDASAAFSAASSGSQTSQTAVSAVSVPHTGGKRATAGVKALHWFYRHFTVRKLFSGMTRLCLKLELERTPFYRIVSAVSSRMELRYLAAGLAVGMDAEQV